MIWNEHYRDVREGAHAPFGASKYSWLNYDEEKALSFYKGLLATQKGTELHALAKSCIQNRVQLNGRNTLAKYVNDVVILNKSDVSFVKANYCSNVHVIPHASFSYYVNSLAEDTQLKYKIGFIGRIEPYKGLDLLVDAFLKLDERFNLIIAGSGKIDNSTLQKITSNNRIELINRYIKDDEFSVLLNKMDVVVLPYKRASQSGVIPLVFAHGKPVIVTNVGALEEQVPEGTGIVTKADVDSLVKSIFSLYNNPQLILEYGKMAKFYAETNLSWEHSAKLLNDIIADSDNHK